MEWNGTAAGHWQDLSIVRCKKHNYVPPGEWRLYTGKWIWIGESSQDGAFVMSSDVRHRCRTDVKRYSTSSSDRNFILKKGGGRFVRNQYISVFTWFVCMVCLSSFYQTLYMLCRVLTLRKIYNTITLPPLQHFILIWKCCAVINICPSGVSALFSDKLWTDKKKFNNEMNQNNESNIKLWN